MSDNYSGTAYTLGHYLEMAAHARSGLVTMDAHITPQLITITTTGQATENIT
jgi:hypothetical protein